MGHSDTGNLGQHPTRLIAKGEAAVRMDLDIPNATLYHSETDTTLRLSSLKHIGGHRAVTNIRTTSLTNETHDRTTRDRRGPGTGCLWRFFQ